MDRLLMFLSGILFAIGLGLSGMMNPEKVLSFLNITGVWDPSLLMVMVGAIGVNLLTFPLTLKKVRPVFSPHFSLPTNKKTEKKLIIGSAVFGIGWGLAGVCPGPALANLFSGNYAIPLFVLSMLVGMWVFSRFKL